MGNRDNRRSVEGRGMGRGTQVVPQGFSGRKTGNLKEMGLGWINGGRKDQDFD